MRLFLIGPPGAGKTTLGSILAKEIDYKFIDIDHCIQSKTGKTIVEIFDIYGEDYFRKTESDTLKTVIQYSDVVVATGGGTVLAEENYNFMSSNGFIIYLSPSLEEIWSSIDTSERPLLADKGWENFQKLCNSRSKSYSLRCHKKIEGSRSYIESELFEYTKKLISGL